MSAASPVQTVGVPNAAPINPAASVNATTGVVSLTWDASSGSTYQVLRPTTTMGNPTTLASATNSYSDTPPRGATYYYQIKSVKNALPTAAGVKFTTATSSNSLQMASAGVLRYDTWATFYTSADQYYNISTGVTLPSGASTNVGTVYYSRNGKYVAVYSSTSANSQLVDTSNGSVLVTTPAYYGTNAIEVVSNNGRYYILLHQRQLQHRRPHPGLHHRNPHRLRQRSLLRGR